MAIPRSRFARAGLSAAAFMLFSFFSCALQAQVICVFDPLGTQGEAYNTMKDYLLVARSWGAEVTLKAYVDERVAAEDFKARQCDGAIISGIRARQFIRFPGSTDAIGAIPSYTHLREVIGLLASPRMAPLMVNGNYETAGIIPAGAGYVFVNDRAINTLARTAGKRIAVMEWDKSQAELVRSIGAQPVMSDITNFGGKFNNGQVDVIVAPIIAYKPLELFKGLGEKGGIARYPVVQVTFEMLIQRDRFPPDFGQKSREYVASQVPRAFGMIRNTEREVEQKYWMHVPVSDRDDYDRIMRDARIRLTQEGFYDARMMKLLKRVRCKQEPDNMECSLNDE